MASALSSVAPPMPSSAASAPSGGSPTDSTFGTPAEATALPAGVATAPGGSLAPAADLGTALAALSQALEQLSAVLAAMTGGAQAQGGGATPAPGSGCRCGCSDAQMQAALDQSAQSPVQSPIQAPVTQGAPGADPAAKILPSGKAFPVKDGKVIGHPHAGTHTLGNWQSDNALDIEAPDGTPIYAPADGVISKSAGDNNDPSSRFNGFNFEIEGEGNAWFMQHLSKSLVKDGDHVKKGQLIGHVGSANGVPHLHIGQREGNPDDDFKL